MRKKPSEPAPQPCDPSKSLCSMGIYVFKASVLEESVVRDANDPNSTHDFGQDIIPAIYDKKKVMAYNFMKNRLPGPTQHEYGYWRDIGTVDAYWKASMDLISVTPIFNLYNTAWPIKTARDSNPPAKFVFADEKKKRVGKATDSLVSDGVIVSGGRINRSILSQCVRVNSFANIEESIIFEHVNIGRHAKICRAIIDKDVVILPNTTIGYDLKEDKKRFYVSPEGIVVVPKGTTV